MTLAHKLSTADLFFDQVFVRVKLHLDFDLLKAPAAPHQHFADKVNLAVVFIITGKIVGEIDVTLNRFTAAIAFDSEGVKIR